MENYQQLLANQTAILKEIGDIKQEVGHLGGIKNGLVNNLKNIDRRLGKVEDVIPELVKKEDCSKMRAKKEKASLDEKGEKKRSWHYRIMAAITFLSVIATWLIAAKAIGLL